MILKALVNRRRKRLTEEQNKQNMDDVNAAYQRLFNTNDGIYVLEHMVSIHLTGAIAVGGDNLLDIGVKQGTANHIKEIMQRMTIDS
tara:strand:+ start:3382 stop:3642 length:261 start_codon:yes stop_codon:yes gene_type:complete